MPHGYLAVKGAPSTLLFREKLIHLLLQMGRTEEARDELQGILEQGRFRMSGPGSKGFARRSGGWLTEALVKSGGR